MPNLIPVKQYQFEIELDGIVVGQAQEVQTPDLEADETEHGEGNQIIKTGGMWRINGDIVISSLVIEKGSRFALDWFEQLNNIGNNTLSSGNLDYRTVVIRVRDKLGNAIANETWTYRDCWIKKVGGVSLSRTGSDNLVREIVIVPNSYVTS